MYVSVCVCMCVCVCTYLKEVLFPEFGFPLHMITLILSCSKHHDIQTLIYVCMYVCIYVLTSVHLCRSLGKEYCELYMKFLMPSKLTKQEKIRIQVRLTDRQIDRQAEDILSKKNVLINCNAYMYMQFYGIFQRYIPECKFESRLSPSPPPLPPSYLVPMAVSSLSVEPTKPYF